MILRVEISVRENKDTFTRKKCEALTDPASHSTRAGEFREELEQEILAETARIATRYRLRVREVRFAEGRASTRKENQPSE